jgi:alpha-ribazole phosphatase/probable phosphoglycerate mutase
LYLIRHGQVVTSGQDIFYGQSAVEMSPRGSEQMENVAEHLKDVSVDGIYCSDLSRARKGAEAIASRHSFTPVSCAAFRELNIGLWEGLTFEQVQQRFPGAIEERGRSLVQYRIPQGESLGDLSRRVLPAINAIVKRHHGKNIVLVAHGGVNRVIMADAIKLDLKNFYSLEQDYGCVNIIDYYPGTTMLKLMNGCL